MIKTVLALCACLCLPLVVEAQIAVESRVLRVDALGEPDPRPVAFQDACTTKPVDRELQLDPVGEMNRRFNIGDWNVIQATAKRLLTEGQHAVAKDPQKPDEAAYDYSRHQVWLTWLGEDAFGAVSLRRVLVRASTKSSASGAAKIDLPGVDRFFEVFINASRKATLTTVVTSTEQPNPVLEQIPAVAQKVVPVLLGGVGGLLGSVVKSLAVPSVPTGQPPPPCVPPTRFYATGYATDLPAKRAKLTVASVAHAPLSSEEFREEAAKVSTTAAFQLSSCARALAALDLKAVVAASPPIGTETATGRCQPGDSRAACLDRFDAHLRQAFVTQRDGVSPVCTSEGEIKAMTAVDTTFRTFVAANLAREVKSDTVVANAPLQRFSFGLMEAVAIKAKVHDPRVKIDDDGELQADPLPRLLTIVTFNGSFKGFDPTTVRASKAEQWRWFVGGIITPDFGLSGGLSYMPVRGLAVNTGLGVLFTKTPGTEGDMLDAKPTTATDPFGLGKATVWFFGASYNFK